MATVAGDRVELDRRARALALALFGIACVIAVSLVFLAVGRSEDEERAAAGPAAEAASPSAPPEHERPALGGAARGRHGGRVEPWQAGSARAAVARMIISVAPAVS